MTRGSWFSIASVAAALAFVPAAQAEHWTRGPDLTPPRYVPTSLTLRDGTVLLMGGLVNDPSAPSPFSTTVVRYDPGTGAFSPAADMLVNRAAPRRDHPGRRVRARRRRHQSQRTPERDERGGV